ncbi:ARM repeat-containing protein [Epithele typhae]|uniref:ARM repeat-containing protein n=1 Tax=Epithele typhae TaxID=378194 RepID=UPI00200891A3|nr:ARM repeat-containing protein [Epithele typhae]KAH9932030.1 ARM repeat-containing protein [Epithele typhae]
MSSADAPSPSASTPDAVLDAILKKTRDKAWLSFAPDELSTLLSAFSPALPVTTHTKGYLVLSAFCQRRRTELPKDDEAIPAICRAVEMPVVAAIADTDESEVLKGLTFLCALFDVDHPSATSIVLRDGFTEVIVDAFDFFPKSRRIHLAIAHLLGRAAGHKTSRALVSTDHKAWLENKSRQTQDAGLRAAAAVAMVKLARGASADAVEAGAAADPPAMEDAELARMMKSLVLDSAESSSVADAVEALAFMSSTPSVKDMLSKDSAFLSRLFSLIPRRKGAAIESLGDATSSPLYGTVIIISNISVYRPRLSAEEAQMAKLKRMAKAAKTSSESSTQPDDDPLDDDEHVKTRGERLVKGGVMEALTSAVRVSDSRAVHMLVGKAILSLVEDKSNRGKILQAGGAKALQTIIQEIVPAAKASDAGKTPQIDKEDFEPIQALAKLSITAAPVQVFGPNQGAIHDIIRPFSLMVIHPNSTLLQRFEAMMALTNLSSQSPEVADRIARADGLTNKVELLMLEDHALVRRAATELVCNLVAGSEEVFNKWGGEKNSSSKSKLQVLVALCDIDDTPTRLAASGALASLTASPDACASLAELQRERHRILPILGQLIDPSVVARPEADEGVDDDDTEELQTDPGLVHRGVVCVRNFFVGIQNKALQMEVASDANHAGLAHALVAVVKSCAQDTSSPLLRPAAETLKWLLEHGVELTV